MPRQIKVSLVQSFLYGAPLGYCWAPMVFAWGGTLAMSAGFSFGRRGRAHGPEMFPLMLLLACLLTIILMMVAINRYRRLKAIAADGVEVEGQIGGQTSQSGLATIHYSFDYDGETHHRSQSMASLLVPSFCESSTAGSESIIVVVDKSNPKRAFLRDLFCPQ